MTFAKPLVQLTYILCLIGAIVVVGFGVPLMERLLRKIWPMTLEQEEAHHFREEARRRARRSIDRIPR